ncbi:unnamed protein product, partial [Symbiodinium sp. CCMP2592]
MSAFAGLCETPTRAASRDEAAASVSPTLKDQTPDSDKVRKLFREDREDIAPREILEDLVVRRDQSVMDGLVPLIDKCTSRGLTLESLFGLDEEAVACLYTSELYKSGAGYRNLTGHLEEIFAKILQNAGSDDLGHLTETECQQIWDFGVSGAPYLNVVSNQRLTQVARSYGCTPLAAFLLDSVFTGGLHPPGFKILPMAQASREDKPPEALPPWVAQVIDSLGDVDDKAERQVDVMDAVCIVSLGGAAKTYLLDFFYKLAAGLEAPQGLYVGTESPFRRVTGNFSALAIMAKEHDKIVYCPDEWGLAVMPTRGAMPRGTSAGQMVTMQELINFLTPAGGGMKGVATDRTFDYHNGLATTLQRDRLQCYFFEDHSAATFRVKKALVPETLLFANTPDVGKEFAAKMQQRKYEFLLDELWQRDEDCNEGEPRLRAELSAGAYELVQLAWRQVKESLRQHAQRGDKLLPFLLKFRDIVERLAYHLMLERLHACTEAVVVLGMAAKRGEDSDVPEWSLVVDKVDVRGAINVYLCLLVSERFVINVGEADVKKVTVCSKCKKAMGQGQDDVDGAGLPKKDVQGMVALMQASFGCPDDVLATWSMVSSRMGPAHTKQTILSLLDKFRENNVLLRVERMQAQQPSELPPTQDTQDTASPQRSVVKRRRRTHESVAPPKAAKLVLLESTDLTTPVSLVRRSGQESFPSFKLKPLTQWPSSDLLEALKQ